MSNPVAIVERLEAVIDKLEVALEQQRAENARLRRVETAAVRTLADLDAMLGEGETSENSHLQARLGR